MNARRQISFSFDFDKFVQLVVYLAQQVEGFDILKAVKLIYFIDKHHLIRHGRPITGDKYYRLDYGPVPTVGYDLLKGLSEDYPTPEDFPSDKRVLLEHIEVNNEGAHSIYRAKRDSDLEYFSATELESIDSIIEMLGHQSSVDLMHLSHKDTCFKMTPPRNPIDYYLFFEGEPDASHDALEKMEMEQDDRDFVEGLTSDRHTY